MYAKAVYSVACALYVTLLVSCASTRDAADAGGVIGANQRAASAIEATIGHLETTVSASRERIGAIAKTSEGIANAIDRLEYLFGEYESEVSRLLNEIDALRAELEAAREADSSGGGAFDSGGASEGGDSLP